MKTSSGHGFWVSLLFNMLFRAEWLILSVILLILHFAIGWPLWLIWIPILCWVIHSLLVTVLVSLASSCSNEEKPVQENKNPYSKKTSDFLKK